MHSVLDVRHAFKYDATTGILTHARSGKPAGGYHKSTGYMRVRLNKRLFQTANVIWALVFGVWPPKGMVVDHINRQRDDNRLSNLRLLTVSENQQNRSYKGAHPGAKLNARLGKWEAHICIRGERRYLGMYASPEAASARYLQELASAGLRYEQEV